MLEIIFVIFSYTLVVLSEGGIVDTIGKCSYKDNKCIKNLLQDNLKKVLVSELPEAGIPVLDPFHVENIYIPVLNIINFTIVDGEIRGLKDCDVNDLDLQLEKNLFTVNVTCDIIVQGRFKAFSDSPLLLAIFEGKSISADGYGTVKLDQLSAGFHFFVKPKKGANGKIFLYSDDTKLVEYTYDIKNMEFDAENVKLGDDDVSKMVVELLNKGWKTFFNVVGKPFMDKAVEMGVLYVKKFFSTIPADVFFEEDLSEFV